MGEERLTGARTPKRWATDISVLLNHARGLDHFPISVAEVAIGLSKDWFPNDAITLVQGDNLPGFDGALLRAPPGEQGWGIVYNNAISSRGRINFTLAHEFGHYLVHRLAHPDGMRCKQQDVVRWDTEYGQIEHEANTFAAYLLMPFDDYRRQIDSRSIATLDLLKHCADRYEVSLIAATLRWLAYTERRAILVVSRDGYILWARSSEPAYRSGLFIKAAGRAVPVPDKSVAAHPIAFLDPKSGVNHPPDVWLNEPCQEISIVSESYDFTISLLQFAPGGQYRGADGDEVAVESLNEQIRRLHQL